VEEEAAVSADTFAAGLDAAAAVIRKWADAKEVEALMLERIAQEVEACVWRTAPSKPQARLTLVPKPALVRRRRRITCYLCDRHGKMCWWCQSLILSEGNYQLGEAMRRRHPAGHSFRQPDDLLTPSERAVLHAPKGSRWR
jgi:hypothetical protein